jgi:ArsR family transcriptional regulator
MSNYRTNSEQLAEMFKALSNPHRLAVFSELLSCCTPGSGCEVDQCLRKVVGDLGKSVEIAPSTLSHHLKELNRAGLIEMQRRGKHVECWVDPVVIERLKTYFTL